MKNGDGDMTIKIGNDKTLEKISAAMTIEKLYEFRDKLEIGSSYKVLEETQGDIETPRKRIRTITVAKKYPHHVIDSTGKSWMYRDMYPYNKL